MSGPKGEALSFALAVISAIRHDHNIHHPMTAREIAELTHEIVGDMGCSWQRIYQIEHKALRKIRAKLYRKPLELELLESLLGHFPKDSDRTA